MSADHYNIDGPRSSSPVLRSPGGSCTDILGINMMDLLSGKCSNDSLISDNLIHPETFPVLPYIEKNVGEINTVVKEENGFKEIMAEFEISFQEKVNEMKKLKEEHETAKRHLANLDFAFSDLRQKYERCKNILEGYKLNEEALLQRLSVAEEIIQKIEEKYDSLKAHAKAKIEKICKEMANMRESNDVEIHKLQAIIKRLEIKNASLIVSLDQKNKECLALTALCDEVTGKV